jgi:mono/diheme cytochrome c family protein
MQSDLHDGVSGSTAMKPVTRGLCIFLMLPFIASAAHGGDAQRGKRLAEIRCAVCHIVEPNQRDEVADAPPFMAIGAKFGFSPDDLVFALVGPHAKMNFSLNRPEAEDVAAYISTLAPDW